MSMWMGACMRECVREFAQMLREYETRVRKYNRQQKKKHVRCTIII